MKGVWFEDKKRRKNRKTCLLEEKAKRFNASHNCGRDNAGAALATCLLSMNVCSGLEQYFTALCCEDCSKTSGDWKTNHKAETTHIYT